MKHPTFYYCVLLVIFLLPGLAFGQGTITGKVTDSSTGDPLIGVRILVEGTTTGTTTDINGNYTLQTPRSGVKLTFSYLGYSAQTIEVGDNNVLNVSLAPASTTLDEVVVIGYGSIKKDDATGAIQKVDSKTFNRGAITSPQELLAGKVAGVQISTAGDPGGGSVIRIRGGSSLSATNDPLIIIDNVPVANDGISGSRNPLNIINPNDIETMTVLKDASATAIYGSRASNGVIIITTKKGKHGKKLSVGYAGNVSIGNRATQVDVLSAADYSALVNEQFEEGHPARAILGNANTDWQNEIYETAIGTDHNINFAGALGVLPYRVSVGYTDKGGILKTDRFDRTTVGVNLTPGFLNNTLQVQVNFKAMFSNNSFANRGAIGSAVAFDPTQPIMGDTSAYGGYFTWLQNDGTPNTLAPHNPLALLDPELRTDESSVSRIVTNAQVDYRMPFLPDLRANLNVGYDASSGEGSVFVSDQASFGFVDGGLNQTYWSEKRNELLDFFLNYTKGFGDGFNLDVMGGYSWQHFFREDYSYGVNLDGTKVLTPEDTATKEYYLVSLFGRVNMNIQNRLLLTFTLRRDGTSRFSPENRWGLFPAAAAALKIVDRSSGNLTKLKLRVGYGVTGQQDIGGDFYPYLARYLSSFENARYQFGDQFFTTLRPNGYDANIKWEETTTINAGFDYSLFNDRVYGSFDYYQRETRDLLNFIPVPAGTNLTNFITTNVGDLENNGFEFSLNVVPIRNDKMEWEIGGNVTMNQNKITRLTATEDPNYLGVFTGGISGGVGNTIQIHSVGFPANSFFVYEQVYDDAGVPIEGLYVDRDQDGIITPDDRYQYKQPAPDAFFGFTSNFAYGPFEFLFAGRANVGNYMYNNILSDQAFYNRMYNSTGILNNVHSSTKDIDFTVPQYFSDHFIQDASFLRVDHVTFAYNFAQYIDKVSNLRLSLVVQNPLLITNYTGLDPEEFGGIDGNIYPRSTTYVIGLNANF